MLSLLWMCLNKLVEVNLHKLKTEMVKLANGVTVQGQWLGYLGEAIWNVFEQVWGKTQEQIILWKSRCRCCPVLPMEGDFELWDV